MPGQHLILIKHSAPEVDPSMPAETWKLSAEGRRRCLPLAEKLAAYHPQRVIASEEAKAIETGKLLAENLHIPHSKLPDLGEHDRGNVPHMRSGEFISMVELMFRRPQDRVLGKESAEQIRDRFDRVLIDILRAHPRESLALISHGTILAAWLGPKINRKPFELWRQLGLPSLVALSLPELKLVEITDRFDAATAV